MKRICIAVILATGLVPLGAAADSAQVIKGDALTGVDDLGRVLIAVDSHPTDGLVDKYFLLTAEERLEPWWELIDKAHIVFKGDSLTLRSSPPWFVLSLGMVDREPPGGGYPPFAHVVSVHNGIELVYSDSPDETVALSDLVGADLSSWPEPFWYDLLDPESSTPQCPNDADCSAGGEGSTECSISGCCITQTCSCTMTCSGNSYACCKCLGISQAFKESCRCRECTEVPEP